MRTKQNARKSAAPPPDDSSDEDRPLANWRAQYKRHSPESSGSDGGAPPAAREPRSGAVRQRRAPVALAAADAEQLGAPAPVPSPPAAAPARPGRQLPHGLQEHILQAAVKALMSQGLTAAEAEDALITTAEHHTKFEDWLDEAQVHIATVREVRDEAADLRAAMEVSLGEEAARRAAEAADAATRPLSATLLSNRYGGCKVLSALLGAAPGQVLVQEPLIGPLKELLTLERQCRGKWYPGPGTDHWFTTLAGDLVATLQTMSAGSANPDPPATPCPPPAAAADTAAPAAADAAADAADAAAADAAAPAAADAAPAAAPAAADPAPAADTDAAMATVGAGPEGMAGDGAGQKRKRSSSPEQGAQASPADATGVSDQGCPPSGDDPSSKRAAVAAGAAAGADNTTVRQGGDAAQDAQPGSVPREGSSVGASGGSSSSAGGPAWLPGFTRVVQQQLEHLHQQLALPEVKPPIFVLPEGLAAAAAAQEDSDDDIIVVDIIDRKQSGAAQAAAAASGAAAAAEANQVDLAE